MDLGFGRAPIFPGEGRERTALRPAVEDVIEHGDMDELARSRVVDALPCALEPIDQQRADEIARGAGRDRIDELSVRERRALGRVLLALRDELIRRQLRGRSLRLGASLLRRVPPRRGLPAFRRLRLGARWLRDEERGPHRDERDRGRDRALPCDTPRRLGRLWRSRPGRGGARRRVGPVGQRRVVRGSLHHVPHARRRIDRSVAALQQIHREIVERAPIAAERPGLLQRGLPLRGLDAHLPARRSVLA
ncbi:hypothetical protein predicted by Glimmer/Critica [Sorangium cellulosum So ce56]|uniref:Uncharacterized protein n=1 Tax=Sorangium cellulosum (strain So ce56) TaxID=448385 RepID=A9GUV1_SORC5|nr:hypothetical protein predicted by Glimmer/Critica [Sorangium cellulosum So ce56]